MSLAIAAGVWARPSTALARQTVATPPDPATAAAAFTRGIALVAAAVLTGLVGTYVPVARAANANIVKILRGD